MVQGDQTTSAPTWTTAPTSTAPTAPEQSPTVTAESRGESARSLVWEIVQTVLLTIAIFLAVRSVVQNFRVEGASMDPTLHTGQYLLINKVLYARADGTFLERFVPDVTPSDETNYLFGGPSRGDIIVFQSPGPDRQGLHQARDRAARRDGPDRRRAGVHQRPPLDEPYLTHRATYDFEQKVIPPGQLLRARRQSPQQQRLAPGLVRAGQQPDRQSLGQLLAADVLGRDDRRRLRPVGASDRGTARSSPYVDDGDILVGAPRQGRDGRANLSHVARLGGPARQRVGVRFQQQTV